MDNSYSPLVIIMARAPLPGQCKTRLQDAMTAAEAAALSAAMYCDTVRTASTCGVPLWVCYTPEEGLPLLQSLASGTAPAVEMEWRSQGQGDLGQRLQRALEAAREAGHNAIIVIGTDSPTLPGWQLSDALEHLRRDSTGLVLGPAADGGFYMLGLSKVPSDLFRNVPWSSGQERAAVMANFEGPVHLLPEWYDVDRPADLERLLAEFNSQPRALERAGFSAAIVTMWDLSRRAHRDSHG